MSTSRALSIADQERENAEGALASEAAAREEAVVQKKGAEERRGRPKPSAAHPGMRWRRRKRRGKTLKINGGTQQLQPQADRRPSRRRSRAHTAEQERKEAKLARRKSDQNVYLYFTQILSATRCFESGDRAAAERILETCSPRFRRWEWGYLKLAAAADALLTKAFLLRAHLKPATGRLRRADQGRNAAAHPYSDKHKGAGAMPADHDIAIVDTVIGKDVCVLNGVYPDGADLCIAPTENG